MQEPPQGFVAPGVIKRWLVTDISEGCAAVARQIRVSELLEVEAYTGEDQKEANTKKACESQHARQDQVATAHTARMGD